MSLFLFCKKHEIFTVNTMLHYIVCIEKMQQKLLLYVLVIHQRLNKFKVVFTFLRKKMLRCLYCVECLEICSVTVWLWFITHVWIANFSCRQASVISIKVAINCLTALAGFCCIKSPIRDWIVETTAVGKQVIWSPADFIWYTAFYTGLDSNDAWFSQFAFFIQANKTAMLCMADRNGWKLFFAVSH